MQKQLVEAKGELKDQHAFNQQIGSENMERVLGISESKRKSESTYDAIMTLINRKIDKIRQKAIIQSGSSSSGQGDSSKNAASARNRNASLSTKDSDLLDQLINVRSALLREKAISDELCDNIETIDREIKELHFQDTNQVRNETEES